MRVECLGENSPLRLNHAADEEVAVERPTARYVPRQQSLHVAECLYLVRIVCGDDVDEQAVQALEYFGRKQTVEIPGECKPVVELPGEVCGDDGPVEAMEVEPMM